MPILESLGGLALGAAGSIIGNRIGESANKKAALFQQKLNREDWLMQQEYNNPVNQMKRLEAAGLNKNLVVGGSINNVAGSIGSNSVKAGGSDISANSLLSLEAIKASIANTKANTEATKQGLAIARQKEIALILQNQYAMETDPLRREHLRKQIDNLVTSTDVTWNKEQREANRYNKFTSAIDALDLQAKEIDTRIKARLEENTISQAKQILTNLIKSGTLTDEQITAMKTANWFDKLLLDIANTGRNLTEKDLRLLILKAAQKSFE